MELDGAYLSCYSICLTVPFGVPVTPMVTKGTTAMQRYRVWTLQLTVTLLEKALAVADAIPNHRRLRLFLAWESKRLQTSELSAMDILRWRPHGSGWGADTNMVRVKEVACLRSECERKVRPAH